MIASEDLAGLTGMNDEQKFCVIEQLARRRLAEAQEEAASTGYGGPQRPRYSDYDYAVTVSAAATEFRISELNDFELPWPGTEEADDHCRMYRAQATRVSQRLLFRHASKASTVALDGATKQKITLWLTQMREAVQLSDVSPEKKDRLFALIDELQAEVDRERTPVQAGGELWLTVCAYVAQGASKLEPVAGLVTKIGAAFGICKQAEDSRPKLPPSQKPKQIEPPKPAAKKKPNGRDKLDDEIPL